MSSRTLLSVIVVSILCPLSAFAQETKFFAGLDLSGGATSGSSSTTNGGAPFAGGGVVSNVTFGNTVGIGGHVGYRFTPAFSSSLSYQHIWGDVGWDASFPLVGSASGYAGSAISDAILANAAYDLPLSDATAARVTAGLGLTFNTLSNVAETTQGTGIFLSQLKDHTAISPMAQMGAGIRHRISPTIALNLDAAIAYLGEFRTGNTRRGNVGVTEIRPYEIEDVWRASLGASIQFDF